MKSPNQFEQGSEQRAEQSPSHRSRQECGQSAEKGTRRFVRILAGSGVILAGLCALAVYVFDPFYHYHKPWFSLKAVLNEKEYQVVGSLQHFEYDSVLVGSSVVENNDNAWYDEAFGGTTIKAVRSYGGVADLVWYLNIAFEEQEVRQVFFNLDPASLTQEAETTFEASGCPMYLYDENPFNDVKYLFNKTVLLEKIPYEIAQSLSGDYNEGLSYNWAEGKDFSENGVLTHYVRKRQVTQMLPADAKKTQLEANLALLTQVIEAHPETQFYFFIPPYSMIWWDDAIRNGLQEVYLYDEERVAETLLQYDNVKFYDFQNMTETVTDLNRYMDTVYFDPQANYEICQAMAADTKGGADGVSAEVFDGMTEETVDETAGIVTGGAADAAAYRVTSENLEETFARTRSIIAAYEAEQIPAYEAEDRFVYDEE